MSASSSPQPTSIWTLRPQTLFECLNSSLTLGIRCGPVHQHADAAYTIGLLRTHRERTCDRHSAQCRLYPQKRTLGLSREMSALCQKQTLASSFDHLVCNSHH